MRPDPPRTLMTRDIKRVLHKAVFGQGRTCQDSLLVMM